MLMHHVTDIIYLEKCTMKFLLVLEGGDSIKRGQKILYNELKNNELLLKIYKNSQRTTPAYIVKRAFNKKNKKAAYSKQSYIRFKLEFDEKYLGIKSAGRINLKNGLNIQGYKRLMLCTN